MAIISSAIFPRLDLLQANGVCRALLVPVSSRAVVVKMLMTQTSSSELRHFACCRDECQHHTSLAIFDAVIIAPEDFLCACC